MGDFNGENYNDSFISKLVDFVAGDKFQTMFETFFLEHALDFDDNEEHKLIYTEHYQKFHDMFDKQLEDFCDSLEITQGEFMKRCREASTKDSKANHYITILLGSVEYDTFVKLMKIMRPVAQMRLGMTAAGAGDAKDVGDAADAKGLGEPPVNSSPAKAASKHSDNGQAVDDLGAVGVADAKSEGKDSMGDKVGMGSK